MRKEDSLTHSLWIDILRKAFRLVTSDRSMPLIRRLSLISIFISEEGIQFLSVKSFIINKGNGRARRGGVCYCVFTLDSNLLSLKRSPFPSGLQQPRISTSDLTLRSDTILMSRTLLAFDVWLKSLKSQRKVVCVFTTTTGVTNTMRYHYFTSDY